MKKVKDIAIKVVVTIIVLIALMYLILALTK